MCVCVCVSPRFEQTPEANLFFRWSLFIYQYVKSSPVEPGIKQALTA